MKKLFLGTTLLLLVSSLLLTIVREDVLVPPPVKPTRRDNRRRLLDATVRIRMFAHMQRADGQAALPPNGATDRYDLQRGCGTVVRTGGKAFVVTHNHWGFPFADVSHVRFMTTDHRELAVVNGAQFLRLLIYRDPGTLIMLAPDPMQELPGVELSVGQLDSGGLLNVVYLDPLTDEFEVIPMTVDAVYNCNGYPAWQLRSPTRMVMEHGNSGAGVFRDGRFAGNMWTTFRLAVGIPGDDGHYARELDTLLSSAARFPDQALAVME